MAKEYLSATHYPGLTSSEAALRLKKGGANEISTTGFGSRWSELRRILLDPMGVMLLGLAGLYAMIGNKSDAVILGIAYLPVTAVDVLLDFKARKALKSMRAAMQFSAKVLRDGFIQQIPTREIVRGDLILFEEGQALPADGRVLEAEHLCVNEAPLTGESIPIDKISGDKFFGGTLVLKGNGMGLVEGTGSEMRYGKIALLLDSEKETKTPLQQKIHKLFKQVFLIALLLALLLLVIEKYQGHDWFHSVIVALTFGMAGIPEEFPLVFTLYLSLGAWRLSRHGVLVKSLPSVEALGSVDVICTDKTGTLTEGRFQLEKTIPFGNQPAELLGMCALMACELKIVDAMESAIYEKQSSYRGLLENCNLKWDYSFETQGKHMSHVWQNQEGQFLISMKGAVEGVLEHCLVSTSDHQKIIELTNNLAAQGKRLLGLAYRRGHCTGNRDQDEKNLTFLGLLAFNDPIRESTAFAINECQKAGIEVKMLTGDHPFTAHAVADEIGLLHNHDYLFSGKQLAEMSQEQRITAFRNGAVFARLAPEQKFEMVQLLKAAGKVVAMTGDGINDAPALNLADVGISMGLDATDVARSTSQMILMKNDFRGIVEAVFEGRRIFANLKRSFSYLIAFHVPVILLAFLPPLLGWGDLLLPIQIVLLQLIVHPVSAFAFENLGQVPQNKEKVFVSARRFFESALSGVILSGGSLVVFRWVIESQGIEMARTRALVTVLFGVIGFIFLESWPAKTVRLGVISVILALATIALCRFPLLGNTFHFSSMDWKSISIAFGVGILSALPGLGLRIRRKLASPPGFEPGFSP